MKKYLHKLLLCIATVGFYQLFAPAAFAASLSQVSNFGNNPSNLDMHLYVPDNVQSNAPLLLAVHYCTGTVPRIFSKHQLQQLSRHLRFYRYLPNRNAQL